MATYTELSMPKQRVKQVHGNVLSLAARDNVLSLPARDLWSQVDPWQP